MLWVSVLRRTELIGLLCSSRSVVFLLHIALEIPLAIQGVWSPTSLPFVQLNNTTLVVLKVHTNHPQRFYVPGLIGTQVVLSAGVCDMRRRPAMLLSPWYVERILVLEFLSHA